LNFVEAGALAEYERLQDDKAAVIGNRAVNAYVISDTMDPIRHMGENTGKLYDSKSTFRAKTKELGLVEVGNDTSYLKRKNTEVAMDKRSRGEAIKRAIYELKNR